MQSIRTWKNKVIYQIFPRSFKDSNNDGQGDLKGITSKLDYLQELGIDAIWLNPIYETEFADAGYDVLDYFKVWQTFGTLEDFKELASEAKKRNIEIIMDLVLNHVSNKHKWFLKALEDPNSEEFNYFIWSKKADQSESIFGGSAWEYVEQVDQYYYHLFAKEQVDLNWENPNVVKSMAKVIDFWYQLGVKGFRLDAIQHVHKELLKSGTVHSFGSKMVEYLQNLIKEIKKNKNDVFLIGEASGITPSKLIKYANDKTKIADTFYNFSWWWIGWGKETGRNGYDPDWKVEDFASKNAMRYQNSKLISGGQFINFLTNHDTSRAVSRYIKDQAYWDTGAKSLALFTLVQKGIPSINYGEEIALSNADFKDRSEFRDVDALNSFKIYVDQKNIYTEEQMREYHNINGRDHSRLIMSWDDSQYHGFSNHEPWIKFSENVGKTNVLEQKRDPNTILNFYKQLIKLRKTSLKKYLIDGESKMKIDENNLISITRKANDGSIIRAYINLNNYEINLKFNKKKIILNSSKEIFENKLDKYQSILVRVKDEKN
ncbi:alpha-amylase family glycosyl hydrolase [Mycoplasmopsis agassizii]|uniref:Alpha-amylase n=1 Tax=Mycoplasmopsis agassizii TaxID=33922 RepID=A0ABX4H5Z4_9BACT|nr:alpha-amylase family glycosyl hydrolase [Mycoplasmopsis agassizii]PAF55327.1 sucrase-isomaltase [Mycoplasmopsis agassizii]SMC15775.1 oligo-1,6-glucosidase [Mycoplasmopsis agassizii]